MKRLIFVCLWFAIAGVSNYTIAQQPKDTSFSKAHVDSLKKAHADAVKIFTDSLDKAKQNTAEIKADAKLSEWHPIIPLSIVILFFVVMIVLFTFFFRHIKERRQRIGFQSIKLIGLILIFPGICILAIIGGEKVLSGQTLAVLLGTIAGYVLSRDEDSAKEKTREEAEKEKEEAELKGKITELEEKIKIIKEKNPGLVEG